MEKSQAVINKYLQKEHTSYLTKARYWSDYKRLKEWFYGL